MSGEKRLTDRGERRMALSEARLRSRCGGQGVSALLTQARLPKNFATPKQSLGQGWYTTTPDFDVHRNVANRFRPLRWLSLFFGSRPPADTRPDIRRGRGRLPRPAWLRAHAKAPPCIFVRWKFTYVSPAVDPSPPASAGSFRFPPDR